MNKYIIINSNKNVKGVWLLKWCFNSDMFYICQSRPIKDDYSNNISKASIFEIDRPYFNTNRGLLL